MLEIRPCCEHCGISLPNESDEAMICTYECTFCKNCAELVLKNVCPNCGGGFEKRPTRPHAQLEKFPVKKERIINQVSFNKFLEANKNIDPRKR